MEGNTNKSFVGIDGLRARSTGRAIGPRSAVNQVPRAVNQVLQTVNQTPRAVNQAPRTANQASQSVTKGSVSEPRPMQAKTVAPQSVSNTKGVISSSVKKTKKNKSKKLNPKIIVGLGLLFVAIVVVVVSVLYLISRKPDNGEGSEENPALLSSNYDTTEDENATTKKIMDEMIEIEIGELEQIEDEYGTNSAIPISVKNISKEKFSVAIEIVAKDSDGKPLDVASLYAEGIEPGQVQLFHAFVLSSLSDEQLRNAKFEVHKAYTYDNGQKTVEETVEIETTENTNSENTEGAESNEINTETQEGE